LNIWERIREDEKRYYTSLSTSTGSMCGNAFEHLEVIVLSAATSVNDTVKT